MPATPKQAAEKRAPQMRATGPQATGPQATGPLATAKRTGRPRASLRKKLLLATATFVFTVGVLEASLWLFAPLPPIAPDRQHEFLPSWTDIGPAPRVLVTDPGPLPGVTPGTVRLVINRFGFLYPQTAHARASEHELRIAVVGGSTAECSMLAADKRWSAVLQRNLERQLDRPVTVLNLGISAQDTRTHLATTSHVVTDLDVDVCVYMLGANDLGIVTSGEHPMLKPDAWYPRPKWSTLTKGLMRNLQIARHLHRMQKVTESVRTTPYFAEAAAEQVALPELEEPIVTTDEGLAHYARNVRSLAGICKEHGIRVLFTTQPCMFGDDPTPEEKRHFWGCHTGTHAPTTDNFRQLLATTNDTLRETCRQHGYPCVDMDQHVPKGFAGFYDQVHFNEAGAEHVAEALVAPILSLLR